MTTQEKVTGAAPKPRPKWLGDAHRMHIYPSTSMHTQLQNGLRTIFEVPTSSTMPEPLRRALSRVAQLVHTFPHPSAPE